MSRLSIKRQLRIELRDAQAAFLWGPRKVGKSTFLRQRFPAAMQLDLLDSDLRTRLTIRPALLRERVLRERPRLVVLDEVQKVPALLDEVHWLIENTKTRFVLCGSSARKLRHGAANLLGGRAIRFELHPLTTAELQVPDQAADALPFLRRLLNRGGIPSHYLARDPDRLLRGYTLDYLAQEIQAEALTRNVPAFARFLDAVALTHGQLINYANIARDCGVSAKTVREYFQILDDTLLGHRLPPWRRTRNRRLIETEKYYLFDVGVVRALCGMHERQPGSDEFGRSFEHLMIEQVRACLAYRESDTPLSYWRTSTGQEVDLIVGELVLAIEFKARHGVDGRDAKGLRALIADQRVRTAAIVSLDAEPRVLDGGIEVWPWQLFCSRLWAGDWI
jgi:predicted AAA+ superfamily ATPase